MGDQAVQNRTFSGYQFAPGEAESMVESIRNRSHVAATFREEATKSLTSEERCALRRRASQEEEASEHMLLLLLERVKPHFVRAIVHGFPKGSPGWVEMRDDAMAEMVAQFVRCVPSSDHQNHLFVERFLVGTKFLALKAIETVRRNNERDPRTGKTRLPLESLDAPIGNVEGEAGESRHTVEADPRAYDFLRDAEADNLLTILLVEVEQRLQSKNTLKQRAIGRRRIEAFCLRIAGVTYDRIATLLGVDPRTERSDIEAVGAALTKVVSTFIKDGLDITPEEVIAVLRDFGHQVDKRLSTLRKEQKTLPEQ